MRFYRRLLLVATLLAFAVIALGAYVRLSDAGLGCPDWPGCYGHWLGVPDAAHEQQAARIAFPERPINTGKAWKEMLHRYLAGTLGLLILSLCLLAWRKEFRQRQSPALPTLLLCVVGVQAALGMWTVTLLLKPLIVTLHLIGGMTTLSLLIGLALRDQAVHAVTLGRVTRIVAASALLAIIVQIALGGWVSSNYAALACTDFPSCQGQWDDGRRPVVAHRSTDSHSLDASYRRSSSDIDCRRAGADLAQDRPTPMADLGRNSVGPTSDTNQSGDCQRAALSAAKPRRRPYNWRRLPDDCRAGDQRSDFLYQPSQTRRHDHRL